MNNYDIGNPSAGLPDEVFATTRMNDNYTTAPSSQEFHYNADMNLLDSQQLQPQNTDCNENFVIQNEDSMSGVILDFDQALMDPDLIDALNTEPILNGFLEGEILPTSELSQNHLDQPSSSATYLMQSAPNDNFSIMQPPLINQNNSSIETKTISCNEWISLQSPATDLSALTSLSMSIQSPSTSYLNDSTVLQPLSSSGGQPNMELPCSYQLQLALQQQAQQQLQQQQQQQQQLPQQQPINNTAILNISIQPENNFRFRYKTEIHEAHGYLPGTGSAGNNLRKFTTVDLRFNQTNEVVGEYFVRCTLHQASLTPTSIHHAPLSPYELLQRSDNGFHHETELYPLRKVGPNLYKFEMENFLISCPHITEYVESCREKIEKLSQQNVAIGSKLICNEFKNVVGSDLEAQDVVNEKSGKKGTKKKQKKQGSTAQKLKKKEFSKVQIGFEAFQLIDNSYKSITDPIFSNVIVNGGPLIITKICNSSVLKDEDTEVTLLVSPLETTNIKIHLEECGNIAEPWRECILVDKKMVHHNSAISFRAPRYGGTRQDAGSITCSLQLECDGVRSNAVTMFYGNGIKRNKPIDNDVAIRPIVKSKSRRSDQVTTQTVRLTPDAVLFTDKPSANMIPANEVPNEEVIFIAEGSTQTQINITINELNSFQPDAVLFTDKLSPSEIETKEYVKTIMSRNRINISAVLNESDSGRWVDLSLVATLHFNSVLCRNYESMRAVGELRVRMKLPLSQSCLLILF